MKIEQKLALANVEGKIVFVNPATGKAFNPVTELNRCFNVKPGEFVPVLIFADDGKNELPFSIDTLRTFVFNPKKGIITTAEGIRVKVFSAKLDGDYPIVGTVENRPYLWKADGQEKEGREEFRLVLHGPKEEDAPETDK